MATLFMLQIGARPKGRLIEQHDVFFGVADAVHELIPAVNAHWQEVKNQWHIDAYREVTIVDGYQISWVSQSDHTSITEDTSLVEDKTLNVETDAPKLYFVNLGGYLPNDFEEYHHKLLIVAPSMSAAIARAKQCEFYKHFGFSEAGSASSAVAHVDDKHQVDVDDIYEVAELLSQNSPKGRLVITAIEKKINDNESPYHEDKLHVGYLSLKKLQAMAS